MSGVIKRFDGVDYIPIGLTDNTLSDYASQTYVGEQITAAEPGTLASAAAAATAAGDAAYLRVHGVPASAVGTDAGATINAVVVTANAAGGGIVDVSAPGTYTIETPIVGLSNVTLRLGQGVTLKLKASANDDIISATSADNFHVVGYGAILDGNKANQTGTGLSGDDPAIVRRGVFLSSCTNSSVRGVEVTACRMHGVLVYLGSDNVVEDVEAHANGTLAGTCYGNGILISSSPRTKVNRVYAHDNDANSGVVTVGASACDDVAISAVFATGNDQSNISLNSRRAKLTQWYAAGSLSRHGLNLGHDTDAALYCDDFEVGPGQATGNALAGVQIAGALGGKMTGVTSKSNVPHNLAITGARAGHFQFFGCDFDTTTSAGASPLGVGILISDSGAGSAIGDISFDGCNVRRSTRQGLRISGPSDIQFNGGIVEDNTGAGIDLADSGALLPSRVSSVGTTFRDSGVSTQTQPFSQGGTGTNHSVLSFVSSGHTSTNTPGSSVAWGIAGGVGVVKGGGAITGTILTATSVVTAPQGSVGNPGLSFASRPTQGLFSLGGATVGASAGGAETFRWDGSALTLAAGRALTAPSTVNFTGLPTADPVVAGRLWNDAGTLKISAG